MLNSNGYYMLWETQKSRHWEWEDHGTLLEKRKVGDLKCSGIESISFLLRLKTSRKSYRWKIFVEIEGQGVKFLAPCITLERSEPIPPVFTSVFSYCTISSVKSVVKNICHQGRNKGFWLERNIDYVVEL